MRSDVILVRAGDSRYEELLGQIRTDQLLLAQMWADAEHRLDERPDKVWSVAIVHDGRGWVPAAWAAAVAEADVLRCSDNYERHGYRGRDLYAAAYAHRHATVVQPSGLPGETYLFAQPIPLHEADGWHRTGLSGVSVEAAEPHQWWQLRRAA
ncbi:hypothetical protein OOJ91_34175 [Micromonospora lupini]|uniref:hypothetical protein n=1 Tax=Micromonospora lupini TaxID=285679 RepID=UPI00225242B2|nr:hypothetical protein [Micromonospora lupini]MCX5070897.1 hypothetical protein [Micromonospora lupini]